MVGFLFEGVFYFLIDLCVRIRSDPMTDELFFLL